MDSPTILHSTPTQVDEVSSLSNPSPPSPQPTPSPSTPLPPASPSPTPSSSSLSPEPPSSPSQPAETASTSEPPAGQQEEGGDNDDDEADVDLATIGEYQGHDISVDDEEIRRAVWQGAIPVVIHLAESERATNDKPQPFYLMASRLTYFPVISSEFVEYFRPFTVAHSGEFWLETIPQSSSSSSLSTSSSSTSISSSTPSSSSISSSQSSSSSSSESPAGIALKWHYPVGVLFDLYGGSQPLPWRLTLHYHRFPLGQLIRCEHGVETARAHYMNVLKEANYLKYGMLSQVQKLPLKQTKNLWQAVAASHYDLYHQLNQSLGAEPLLALPVRLLRPGQHFVQHPVQPLTADGAEKTLRQVVQELLPRVELSSSSKVVVQGITPPLDTPILWLSTICMHPEHFLWIILL